MNTAAVSLLVLALGAVLSPHTADALLSNTVTDWLKSAQSIVAQYGIPSQLSARLYGLVSLTQLATLNAAKKQQASPGLPETAFAGGCLSLTPPRCYHGPPPALPCT